MCMSRMPKLWAEGERDAMMRPREAHLGMPISQMYGSEIREVETYIDIIPKPCTTPEELARRSDFVDGMIDLYKRRPVPANHWMAEGRPRDWAREFIDRHPIRQTDTPKEEQTCQKPSP